MVTKVVPFVKLIVNHEGVLITVQSEQDEFSQKFLLELEMQTKLTLIWYHVLETSFMIKIYKELLCSDQAFHFLALQPSLSILIYILSYCQRIQTVNV